MFLDLWMIAVLVLLFGICAYYSTISGFRKGAFAILETLEHQQIIVIHNDGSISPYSSSFEKLIPTKKKRKKVIKNI